jgi:hypothetical protein
MERERVIAGKRDNERVRKKDRGRGEKKERDILWDAKEAKSE